MSLPESAPLPTLPIVSADVPRQFARRGDLSDAQFLYGEVARRMLGRLQYIRVQPQAMLDAGCGAGDNLPGELFETGDPARWEHADTGLSSAYDSVRAFGGNLWLAKEGPTGVVFEIYLPRGGKR